MKTKLTRIKYYRWNGNKLRAYRAFANEDGVKPDFSGDTLILRMNADGSKYIRIPRNLFVVGIASPQLMGYVYYRMSEPQLKQYLGIANRGGQIVLD